MFKYLVKYFNRKYLVINMHIPIMFPQNFLIPCNRLRLKSSWAENPLKTIYNNGQSSKFKI